MDEATKQIGIKDSKYAVVRDPVLYLTQENVNIKYTVSQKTEPFFVWA